MLPGLFLLISPSLSAQIASTNAVSFVYNTGQAAPPPQTVTISGAMGTVSARISQNVAADGTPVTTDSDNSGVFSANVALSQDGTWKVAIGTNPYQPSILAGLAALGPAGYRGTLLASADNCVDCISVFLYLQIGGSGAASAFWNGQNAISGITMAASQGSIAQTGLVLVTTTQTSYVAASNQSWLAVSPGNGTAAASPAGGAVINLTAYASSLTNGSYYAVVTISTGVGAISVPVTFNVGYLSGLTLSPSSMAFQYAWNAQSYSWGPSSVLTVSGALLGTGFTATSSANWLLVNGYTSASGIVGSNVAISVNASALGNPSVPNTYTAYVYFYSNGLAGTLPVTLTVTGAGTTTNSSLFFSATTSVSSVSPQYVTISGYGSYYTVINRYNGGTNWLAVSPATGTVSGSVLLGISVNPAGLPPGTYSGALQVYLAGGLYIQGFAVTMTISAPPAQTPVFSISTHSMTFSYQQGGSVPPAQTLQASTDAGSAGFSASSSAAWITVTPSSGTAPAAIDISVNPAGLGVGTQTGTVYVTAPGAVNGTHTVTVKLEITSPPSLATNTNSLAFTYRMGGAVPDSQAVHLTCTGATVSFTVSTPDVDWFSVRQSGSATPATLSFSVNPAGLPAGQHNGRVTIDAGTATHTIALSLVVMPELPTITGIYNGASFLQGAIAPGEVVILSGTSLGPATPSKMTVSNNLVSTSLAGTRVLIGGIPAPLMHADQIHVTALVPYAIAGRSSTIVQLERNGERSNCLTVEVAVTAPGVFTLNGSGTGPGAVVNEDGTVNSVSNPAVAGSIVSIYGTGEGQTLPFGIDGQMAGDLSALPKPVLPLSATISGLAAEVLYAGAAPHAVAGMLQVNVRVPQDATSGDVVLTIGGRSSQLGVTMAVR